MILESHCSAASLPYTPLTSDQIVVIKRLQASGTLLESSHLPSQRILSAPSSDTSYKSPRSELPVLTATPHFNTC
ncbi:hypothetical protein PAXRUDRAFT_827352 [Paxillus rubicundulus Ve08.2h10]|uniref:Uncharacterized protein n=1 Tax=Paxillus rubicundulus Ve08.2h10 TaxID=930991 RepID=A0A0D0DCW9_9AGAM|nr:hypothetical protein PAXRUDRAFT_827352 [Paxillus rubicundulus Ve08.2h10]